MSERVATFNPVISLGNVISIVTTVLSAAAAVGIVWVGFANTQTNQGALLSGLERRVTTLETARETQNHLINAELAKLNARMAQIDTAAAVAAEQLRSTSEQIKGVKDDIARFRDYLEARLGIKPPR